MCTKVVKILTVCLFGLFSSLCAGETTVEWRTAGGNSYLIYETFEWAPQSKENKNPGTLFFINYQTQVADKNDKAKISAEYADILTHYYHFYLPRERKDMSFYEKKNHHVIIRAFFKEPVQGKQNQSINFTQNINGVEIIAKENKNIDPNRLAGLKHLHLAEAYHRAKKFSEAVKYYHMALKGWRGRVPASGEKDQQAKEIEAQLRLAQKNLPL